MKLPRVLVKMGGLQNALVKSNLRFPGNVNYYRALAALHLQKPQLGILIGTMEARNAGTPISELKRSTVEFSRRPF